MDGPGKNREREREIAKRNKQMITITGWFIYRDISSDANGILTLHSHEELCLSFSFFFAQEALNFHRDRTADNWRKPNNELNSARSFLDVFLDLPNWGKGGGRGWFTLISIAREGGHPSSGLFRKPNREPSFRWLMAA